MYNIQRVYTYQHQQPAVLIDRLWPRGISKIRLSGVEWLPRPTSSENGCTRILKIIIRNFAGCISRNSACHNNRKHCAH